MGHDDRRQPAAEREQRTLAEALRDLRPDLPVVLASGYITDDLRARAPAAGIRELIYKPNTVDDLCAAVARVAHAGAPI